MEKNIIKNNTKNHNRSDCIEKSVLNVVFPEWKEVEKKRNFDCSIRQVKPNWKWKKHCSWWSLNKILHVGFFFYILFLIHWIFVNWMYLKEKIILPYSSSLHRLFLISFLYPFQLSKLVNSFLCVCKFTLLFIECNKWISNAEKYNQMMK